MSSGKRILDELSFAPAALAPLDPQGSRGASAADVRIPIAGEADAGYRMASPFFVRETQPTPWGTAWPLLCQLLARHGVPMFTPASALGGLPATDAPPRFGLRYAGEPIDADELRTAGLFELACHQRDSVRWGWSAEASAELLPDLVRAVRRAAGAAVPIGLGLPLPSHPSDLRHAVDSEADFLTLVSRSRSLDIADIVAIRSARRLCDGIRPQRPPALLVAAPVGRVDHAIKLLALGATAVCIDALLARRIPRQREPQSEPVAGRGMLSGITGVAPPRAVGLPDVERLLEQLDRELMQILHHAGVTEVGQLSASHLRACTARTQQATGIPSWTA